MTHRLPAALAIPLTLTLVLAGTAAAQDIADVMAYRPVSAGVEIDTPTPEEYAACRLQRVTEPAAGFVVVGPNGLVVRRTLDTDGDGQIDRWAYFRNGQPVYADGDADGDGKPDTFSWYHTAGSRQGRDSDGDGAVDSWDRISAEEATAEAVAALTTKDYPRLARVMAGAEDAARLGLGEESAKRLTDAAASARQQFDTLAAALPPGTQWTSFEAPAPVAVPAAELGGKSDTVMYANGTVVAEAGERRVWLQVPEVVQVGPTWKLTGVPALLDPEQPVSLAGVLVQPPQPLAAGGAGAAAPDAAVAMHLEDSPKVREYYAALQKHDADFPEDAADTAAVVAYHTRRAELCAYIGSQSAKLASREYWYRQTADSIAAAVQTGGYDKGIDTLRQYGEQFAQTDWGKGIGSYFAYRAVNSAYAVQLADPEVDQLEAQKDFLASLEQFLEDHPKAPDAPAILWQIANGKEFSADLEGAKETYAKLVADHPEEQVGKQAAGALRRLDADGGPMRVAGAGLTGSATVDTAAYRDRLVLVHYWATWCEPCLQHMQTFAKLDATYGQALQLVGVNLDGDRAAAAELVAERGYGWPMIHEPGGLTSDPAVDHGIISLPYMVLLGKDGRVVRSNVQYAELPQLLQDQLGDKVATSKR